MYNEVIYLCSFTNTGAKDEFGDDVLEEHRRAVFASCKSVGMKEFYQAQSVGLKPEITFELADFYEYAQETEVVYEGMRYKVLRTYRKGIQLEIVCYGGVRDANATISN